MKTFLIATTIAALASFAQPALAQMPMDHSKMGAMPATEMSDGEVRKIDMEQGKITLKHGPIKNLDMPGMTMVFYVKDKAMLEGVKTGDKLKFKAENEKGKMTVTEMMPAK